MKQRTRGPQETRRTKPEVSGAQGTARGSGDGGALDASRREVFGKLGMPCPRLFGDGALGGHPFLDCATAIITLVRFHWSPLR